MCGCACPSAARGGRHRDRRPSAARRAPRRHRGGRCRAGARAAPRRRQRAARAAAPAPRRAAAREGFAVRDERGGPALHLGDDAQALAGKRGVGCRVIQRHAQHGGVGVLGRPGRGLPPDLDHAVVRHAQVVQAARRLVRVRGRHAHARRRRELFERDALGRGQHQPLAAEVERAQRHERVERVRASSSSTQVRLVMPRSYWPRATLDRDVLLGEDAHQHARPALDREAVGARSALVALDGEAGRAQALGERRAQVASGKRDANHDAASGDSAASRSRSAANPEAGAARPPTASAMPS